MGVGDYIGAALEPNLQLLTDAVSAPVAGIAGLGTAAGRALGITNRQPGDVVRSVENALTYSPKTRGGKAAAEVIGYPFKKLADVGQAAGGKTTDVLSKVNALRGGPAAAAGAGVNTAIQALPSLFGAKPAASLLERAPSSGVPSAAQGASSALRAGAERLMHSALKPSAKHAPDAPAAVNTLLEKGINVTPGGLEKLNDNIDALNKKIADKIEGSSSLIDKQAVATRLYDVIDRFSKQVDPHKDLATIERTWENFMNNPLFTGKDIPIKVAQQVKQGTYTQLRKKYGELGSAETEAQKALARGLKEEIAKALPPVHKLNAEESKLLTALPMVERRVIVSANKNPLGLSVLALHPKNIAVWMADRSELFKSLIARMLNFGSKKIAPGQGASLSPQSLRMLMGGQQANQLTPPPQ